MGARRLRRLVLVAAVLVVCSPVFSRADTGEREQADSTERPENELRIEAAPSTGYGRFAICDSLSRVRYGGLGASARYRHDVFAAKVGGSASGVSQHITDEAGDDPPRKRSRAAVDGVAQIGIDTHYVAAMAGVGLVSTVREGKNGGVIPSFALRFGSYRGVSLRLSVADYEPVAMALAAAELAYQHQDKLRLGFGGRIDAFTLNLMPAARVELPLGPHWLGLGAGAVPAEAALAWQLQLLFDFRLLAW